MAGVRRGDAGARPGRARRHVRDHGRRRLDARRGDRLSDRPPHGLSCDNLVGAEVVTVDGSVLEANETEHAELFWALRGGGGNFGVVTRLDFRLHEVAEVVGGALAWPFGAAAEPMRVFRDVALQAPDDFSTQAVLGHSTETGACVFAVIVCSTGPDEEPELLRRLRRVGGIQVDDVRRRPYLELQSMFDMPFGLRHYWKGHFVRELPDALLGDLTRRSTPSASAARS